MARTVRSLNTMILFTHAHKDISYMLVLHIIIEILNIGNKCDTGVKSKLGQGARSGPKHRNRTTCDPSALEHRQHREP